jgi:hypothetical protein
MQFLLTEQHDEQFVHQGLSPQSFVPFPCMCWENYAPITSVTGRGRTLVLDAALPKKSIVP